MDIDLIPLKQKEKYLEYLLGFISDNKNSKFEAIIKNRMRYLTVVLENIYQSHNTSAVLRSCDCFGIQDVHIIEDKNPFSLNKDIALGASKWLTITKYDRKDVATVMCINSLREKGYKIVATSPHENDFDIDQLPLNDKIALVFGTELNGISPEIMQASDYFMKIPMVGFTESLNISVSVAVSLFYLSSKIRETISTWHLAKEEEIGIMIDWAKSVIKNSEMIEKDYFSKSV